MSKIASNPISTFLSYIALLGATIGNILYFVYITHDRSDSWTQFGFLPAMFFVIVVVATIWSFIVEQYAQDAEARRHATIQVNNVVALTIGGILSAIQASAQWLLESPALTGVLNILLIVLVIYVLGSLIRGAIECVLWIARG
jgi:hypothetical protein